MTDIFADPDHDAVIALSNAGHDWLTACRMVFAPHLLPGRVSAHERVAAAARRVARAQRKARMAGAA